jgi:hypothetical protein
LRCPRCLTEYREGFLECADCELPLAFGKYPDKSTPEDFPRLVGVLDTNDNFALASAATALEQADIIFDVVPITDLPASLRTENPTWGTPPTRILVAAEDEAEARMLVESFEQPVSDTLASQRNIVSPNTVRNDLFLWKGSPDPTLVQRIAAWMLGFVYVGCGVGFFVGAVKDRVKEGFSISVVIEAAFALAIAALGVRTLRNGFPRHTKPAAK